MPCGSVICRNNKIQEQNVTGIKNTRNIAGIPCSLGHTGTVLGIFRSSEIYLYRNLKLQYSTSTCGDKYCEQGIVPIVTITIVTILFYEIVAHILISYVGT